MFVHCMQGLQYLTDEEVEVVARHEYKSDGSTYLDQLMDRIWWRKIITIIPKQVSPNLLTVAGLLATFLAFMALHLSSPDYYSPHSPVVYLFAAVNLFVYQTLDAIDGKQARRTGLCSSLGQLFDHGCDVISTMFFAFVICNCLRLGFGLETCAVVLALQWQLFVYTWLEHHTGIFRCSTSRFLGVTEGHFFVFGLLALGAILGSDVFLRIVTTINIGSQNVDLTVSRILFIVTFGMVAGVAIVELVLSVRTFARRPWSTFPHLFAFAVHLAYQTVLLTSETFETNALAAILAICLSSSIIILRMILSTMARSRFPLIHVPIIPFYVFAGFNWLFEGDNLLSPQLITSSIWVVVVWLTFYLSALCVLTVTPLCKAIGLSCFGPRIPKN